MLHQLKEVLNRSVGDLGLARTVAQCEKTATVEQAIKLLQTSAGGSLAVLDQKKVVGIFTERDVLKKVVLASVDPSKTPIEKLMTANPVTVKRSATVGEVIKKMRDGKFRHLIIADSYGNAEGMISMRDIMDHIANLMITDTHD